MSYSEAMERFPQVCCLCALFHIKLNREGEEEKERGEKGEGEGNGKGKEKKRKEN